MTGCALSHKSPTKCSLPISFKTAKWYPCTGVPYHPEFDPGQKSVLPHFFFFFWLAFIEHLTVYLQPDQIKTLIQLCLEAANVFCDHAHGTQTMISGIPSKFNIRFASEASGFGGCFDVDMSLIIMPLMSNGSVLGYMYY